MDIEITRKREDVEKLQKIFEDELSMAGLELLDNGANLTQIRDTASREIDKLTEDRF